MGAAKAPRLLAISDLHVGYPENREIVEKLRPQADADWLLLAGDVGEFFADIEWALGVLKERFATVVWVPGNHELWTHKRDPVRLRGEERYLGLVDVCRRLGVLTPEDPYPVWAGPGGPAVVAPLFLLYDYSFLPPGHRRRPMASRAPTKPGWCAPMSGCCTPIRTRAARPGAGPGSPRRSGAWRNATRSFRSFW